MRQKWLSVLTSTILSVTLLAPGVGAAPQETEVSKLSAETIAQMKTIIEQQSFSGKPYLYEGLDQIGDTESTNVIVQLTDNPLAVLKAKNKISGRSFSASSEKSALSQIKSQQEQFEDELRDQGISSDVQSSYSKVINAVSLQVTGRDLDKLVKMDNVKAIYPDLEVKLDPEQVQNTESQAERLMNAATYLGSNQLSYKGNGINIGVIDTGIDYMHPVLEDAYAGGWDFVNNDDDPYETTYQDWVKAHNADPEKYPEINSDNETYYTEHGTHVAGIIAARDQSEFNVVGIAPQAKIHAYKVLGPYGSGQSSWVIGGIERAVEDGMDIINLSLGNSLNDSNYITSIAINNAMLDGVVSVIASGNSGPDRYTVGSPGTSTFGITVGNSTLPSPVVTAQADFIETATSVTYATYTKDLMAWNIAENPSLLDGTSIPIVYAGLGYPEDFTKIEGGVKDKAVLIQRGELTFVDKIANAKQAGAKAAIIFNNVPGDIPYLLGDDFSFIPTLSLPQEAGQQLLQQLEDGPGSLEVVWSNFVKSEQPGDDINDTSSRGPVKDNLNIKPDIVAPGTNILSSVPAYGKDEPSANYDQAYARLTGTSMATPQVAGIAALVIEAARAHYPDREFSPFDIKAVLMNTALVLDPTKYDLLDQGAGRVQPIKAVETTAIAEVIDQTAYYDLGELITKTNVTGSINFGHFESTSEGDITKTIRIENLSTESKSYTVTNVVYQTVNGISSADISIDQSEFNLSDVENLAVTLHIPKGIQSSGELQGYIVIQSTDGATRLSIPYAAYFNKLQGLQGFKYINLDEAASSKGLAHYPLTSDGELGLLTGQFESYNPLAYAYIALFDGLDTDGGFDGGGHLGLIYDPVIDDFFYENITENTPVQYTWSGEYADPYTGEVYPVKDGLYTLDIYGFKNDDGSGGSFFEDTDPFIVKTKAPELDVANKATLSSGSSYTGKVKDLNIDIAPALKEGWDQDLIVKDVLNGSYSITTKNGVTVTSGSFEIGQDGSFSIPTNGIAGGYNLNLQVVDQVGLTGSKAVDLTLTANSNIPSPPSGPSPGSTPNTTTPSTSSGTESQVTLAGGTLTETTTDGKVISSIKVSDDTVTGQAESSAKEIVVDLTAADLTKYDSNKITLSAAATKGLKNSGKSLVLQTTGFALTIPASDIDSFIADSVFSIQFATSKPNADHTFSITGGGKYTNASNEFTLLASDVEYPAPLNLTFKLDNGADLQKTGIYSLSDSGKWIYESFGKLTDEKEIMASVQKPGTFTAASYDKTFADLTAHWAKEPAQVAAAHHLFTGKGSMDTFKPNDLLTQAEFKTLFDRLLGNDSDWETRSKEIGASHVLTREEVAVILAQSLDADLPAVVGSLDFKDEASISSSSLAAIQFAKEKGYLQGTGNNTFDPKGKLTRAQAAVLIYRVLQDLQKSE
ncbi:hypothetical protein AWM70_11655 [Paenibacillus yonginensis]|uniref:SLH domain-containing protein n=1 Tax=Paenibacillus yonginensis TaxID=1462996 RepID=A0A1B1N164_9BACL|nr:S8 family serine peptidase [Paenibacillus yonginensis]ANS75177.1 hypothetical protein AWM70_11655 [Paenibacillus yonginensis]